MVPGGVGRLQLRVGLLPRSRVGRRPALRLKRSEQVQLHPQPVQLGQGAAQVALQLPLPPDRPVQLVGLVGLDNLGAAQPRPAVLELALELSDLVVQLRLWRAGRLQVHQFKLLRLQLLNFLQKLAGRRVGSLARCLHPGQGVAMGIDRLVDPAIQRADGVVVAFRPSPPAGTGHRSVKTSKPCGQMSLDHSFFITLSRSIFRQDVLVYK
eukprot:scaffold1081_cov112-Isochrysis_galbana.AAC.1